MRITSELRTSSISLVMAPYPVVSVKPTTVGEWVNREPLSTLLFPMAARMNFCIR